MDKETNLLSGGIETLYTMKENLLELSGYREKSSQLNAEEEGAEKELAAKEKEMNDEIGAVTKKRKDELTLSFDDQIEQTRARMKKVKAKKDKLKGSKVAERIETETADIQEQRVQALEEIKKLYKAEKIPFIFNNRVFYALFLPRRLLDIGIILAALVLILIALPYLIYHFIFPEAVLFLVLSYVITVVLFGGLYVAINRITKEKHAAAFKKIRILRSSYADAQKKIAKKKKAIIKDKDESSYGLEKYNEELIQLDNEVETIAEEKKKALVSFESVTKYAISDEIKTKYDRELSGLKQKHEEFYEEQRKAEDKSKQFALQVIGQYEPFVGKELLTIPQLDKLISVMENGQAKTIAQAVAYVRGYTEEEAGKKNIALPDNKEQN